MHVADRVRMTSWFTMTMSTAGMSNVLQKIPFRFRGLYTLGVAMYILALAMFVVSCVCITIRFIRFKHTLLRSLLHPSESLFVAAWFLSVATLLIGAQGHAAPKIGMDQLFNTSMRVCYWVYCAAAMVFTVSIHLVM